jgi:hypothetical protein
MHSLGKRNCHTAEPNIQHASVISQWNRLKNAAIDGPIIEHQVERCAAFSLIGKKPIHSICPVALHDLISFSIRGFARAWSVSFSMTNNVGFITQAPRQPYRIPHELQRTGSLRPDDHSRCALTPSGPPFGRSAPLWRCARGCAARPPLSLRTAAAEAATSYPARRR